MENKKNKIHHTEKIIILGGKTSMFILLFDNGSGKSCDLLVITLHHCAIKAVLKDINMSRDLVFTG